MLLTLFLRVPRQPPVQGGRGDGALTNWYSDSVQRSITSAAFDAVEYPGFPSENGSVIERSPSITSQARVALLYRRTTTRTLQLRRDQQRSTRCARGSRPGERRSRRKLPRARGGHTFTGEGPKTLRARTRPSSAIVNRRGRSSSACATYTTDRSRAAAEARR